MEKNDVNEIEDVKGETIELLTSWLKRKKDELVRTGKSLGEKRGKIRKMAAQRIHKRWLYFWAKRLLRKIRDLAQEKNAIREAIIELKNDNPDFAMKLVEKRFMSMPVPFFSLGSEGLLFIDPTLGKRYIQLIKGLKNLKK